MTVENVKPTTVIDFREKYELAYGNGFFFSEVSDRPDHHKIIVLTARQQKELHGLIPSYEVKSIEESEGAAMEIVKQYANIYTRPDTDIKYLADQLTTSESFRGLPSPLDPNWVAVAIHHDFEKVAPLELGWVLASDITKKSPTPKMGVEKFLDLQIMAKELAELPYFLAGKSPDLGYDCSGLTQTVIYRTRGLMLPRLSRWQALCGEKVSQKSVAPGDLVFFTEGASQISHVGIVIEPTDRLPVILNSRINKGVLVEDLNEAEWLGGKIQLVQYRRL